ncbi:hypothetical protein GCM10023328_18070 [Modestobacter marinus]|uniref:Uncharacterized protein n=1 Tax=Modestobacter marinus TaxID=477641 RepID=A0A846LKV8_9ACTN|nr:hypothetical protein [Modestobacter marinus]NIH68137.1 hypothetical protein [Modestobacter marinus]GGL80013.1 hypothetical protein GCM10011589_40330 [Modestobacter marinus]
MTRDHRRLRSERGRGRVLPLALVLAASAGLAGCGDDPPAVTPEVSAEELQDLRDDVSALEQRVEALESAPAPEPTAEPSATPTGTQPPAEVPPPFTDGEDVSVRGEVVGLIATTDIGTAFRLSTASGATVAVVSATPVQPLRLRDVVQVTGQATTVQPETFERDFGIAADVLLDDPAAFLDEQAGQVAIAADQVEPADDGPTG